MNADSPALRAARKDEHVRLATEQRASLPPHTDFDDIQLMHHALSAIDVAAVNLAVTVNDFAWPAPIYINGMTGGTELTGRINRELAIAARETGIPMACGSMSVALDDAAAVGSFTVIREENPDGFVMANLGIGRSGDDARRAVEMIRADALQLHLNAVQELVMPEGARNFSSWRDSVSDIVQASPVPVIVKEVGFGLSRSALSQLAELGVTIADVSGAGGTSFLSIENARRTQIDYSVLGDFGQSAIACLLDAPTATPTLLASGGVRHSWDVIKALAAGAKAVGVAGTFLEVALAGGAEELTGLINNWLEQTTGLLALLGCSNPAGLSTTDLLVRGELAEFCRLRNIDLSALATRSTETCVEDRAAHQERRREKP